MKPVFDQKGKYAYVIGLQFDVSTTISHNNNKSDGTKLKQTNEALLSKLQLIDYLLSMLPDRLPFDDLNE